MKNILLSTIGASPQVLTETLYAIHQSGRPFPDEVYVITTLRAKNTLMNGLFRDGHLQALKDEYQLPDFTFDESHIWIIEDENGTQIDDAKSIEDQTSMADFITCKVYELTQDENSAIHASLAGGRKTMAFYFGYAMSLFGREQDVLSHVFVDDAFEFVRDFWYPTQAEKWVTGKNGQGEVDVSQANVTLAEIPFVRMRNSIDSALIASMSNYSFSQTVGMLNASHHDDLSVTIDKSSLLISAVGVDTKLTAKEMAFYLWLLAKGETGLRVDRDFSDNIEHSFEFLNIYSELASDPRVFDSFHTTPEDFLNSEFESLSGMEKEFLQPICSNINRKLKKSFPGEVSDKLRIEAGPKGTDYYYRVSLCQLDKPVTVVC